MTHPRRLHPPRAPPDHLRLQSFQILSRLELIQTFRPWLDHTRYHVFHKNHTPLELLWDCFAFGAPQCTLLNLFGSPSPRHLAQSVEDFDFGLTIEERQAYFESFIQRVQLLEVQRQVPYGEVLRSEDFLSDSNAAFAKVLRTVYRLLFALEEIYPGLFVVPVGSHERRRALVQELIDTERAHLARLENVFAAATSLSKQLNRVEPCLLCLLVNQTQLLGYHQRLLKSLEDCFLKSVEIQWTRTFALDNDAIRMGIFGAYRSICVNYLGLVDHLESLKTKLENSARVVLDHTSTILSRIHNYSMILQDILQSTQPSDDSGYNSLCEAVFRIGDVSETMDEAGRQLRTMHSANMVRDRTYIWSTPDSDDLGVVLLDDRLCVSSEKQIVYSVFFFETMLLCCQEGFDRREVKKRHTIQSYPIYAWELGPALRKSCPLDVVYAIPVSQLESVSCPDTRSIEITWVDAKHRTHSLTFVSMIHPQWDQWLAILEPFVPPISRPSIVPEVTFGEEEASAPLSEDEDVDGHMVAHAKSWSVIARKEPRSETSSFVNQKTDDGLLISPGLLPTLFNTHFEALRSPSPLSATSHNEQSVFTWPESIDTPASPTSASFTLVDLTGNITKLGGYASAHGGFSDVWKGVWHDGNHTRNVAVKVVRSRIDDPGREDKMIKRLYRELGIWKTLDHPHVLSLYGVTSDFGHYISMVCPWMEKGSLSKHIEQCGDIMSIPERLKLLCEIADGLSYLHSHSVIHGDLTGSNVLINDEGHACLCDFGLSSLAVEFEASSGLTSTVGGAVRWADALLYRALSESGTTFVIGTQSDIYSFGSVMLEVLSGRIPYHYIRTDVQVVIELNRGCKPRRPAQSFVSDQQWLFMEQCWNDDPAKRPRIGEVCTTIQMLYTASLQT